MTPAGRTCRYCGYAGEGTDLAFYRCENQYSGHFLLKVRGYFGCIKFKQMKGVCENDESRRKKNGNRETL